MSGSAATQSTIAGQTAIANGTPFDGWLTIDPTVTTPSGRGDSQHCNYAFDGSDPHARFSFQVGNGLYDVTVTSVGNEVDAGYTSSFGVGVRASIWFWSNGGQSVSRSRQAANPLFSDFEQHGKLGVRRANARGEPIGRRVSTRNRADSSAG